MLLVFDSLINFASCGSSSIAPATDLNFVVAKPLFRFELVPIVLLTGSDFVNKLNKIVLKT